MDYVSKGEIVDSFNDSMRLTVNANGEEYRLFGSILDLVQKSVVNEGVCPRFFGSCWFGERFSGKMPYLAREQRQADGFPDCVYINEKYVLCVDHAQSTLRSRGLIMRMVIHTGRFLPIIETYLEKGDTKNSNDA
ncbi:hypothetical protein [Adlercreutzia caecimuris]|uniref:Uncharacterized protein n=1 Tax=Adlercreutzia caecimuris TaxID=671266 RepID=A0A4S4G0N7_9ACTN|nr:hypothetical protein [Adlercreutzia caecimuris]THG36318.1 hypothetical protein E5986_10170 [Adlercreutzia caecimuris]